MEYHIFKQPIHNVYMRLQGIGYKKLKQTSKQLQNSSNHDCLSSCQLTDNSIRQPIL